MKTLSVLLTFSALIVSHTACISAHRVRLRLPAEPVVRVAEDDLVLIIPFILGEAESDEKPRAEIDVQVELMDYLTKTLRKKEFNVHMDRNVVLPTSNLEKLKENSAFWKNTAQEHLASVVLSGAVDFRVEDRSSYETQEFVSQYDNRTYRRQILIQRTGFILDLLLFIFDDEGKLIKEVPLKQFVEHEVRNYDQLTGFFETIHPMEESIVHLFVPHRSRQRRYIYGF